MPNQLLTQIICLPVHINCPTDLLVNCYPDDRYVLGHLKCDKSIGQIPSFCDSIREITVDVILKYLLNCFEYLITNFLKSNLAFV